MALLRIKDFDSDYTNNIEAASMKDLAVYTENDERIGTISDVLVDEEGHFRYLVIHIGFWIFGKNVLLPIGRSRIDDKADRVYAVGMTKPQAEALPEFNDHIKPDYDYEEHVRGIYRNPANTEASMNPLSSMTAPSETTAFIDNQSFLSTFAPLDAAYAIAMVGAMAPRKSRSNFYH